jgi:transcriptional regulator with XRE-family HTH domain
VAEGGQRALFRERTRLAAELHRLRLEAGLSTYKLAARLGLSQSKVTRMETGRTGAPVADVRAWAEATGADAELVATLAEQAERALTEAVAFRGAIRERLPRQQAEIGELERSAGTLRQYQPLVVPGLLQTAEYARRMFGSKYPSGDPAIQLAVAARIERQVILYDETKRFEFVMAEPALRWRVGPVQVQLAQLDRIRTLATMTNVFVGVLPLSAEVPGWAWHGFSMYDDRPDGDPLVHVETLSAALNLSEPDDVTLYRDTFVRLREASVSGEAALELLAEVMTQLRASA